MMREAEEIDFHLDRQLFGLERNVNVETPRRTVRPTVRPISRKARSLSLNYNNLSLLNKQAHLGIYNVVINHYRTNQRKQQCKVGSTPV